MRKDDYRDRAVECLRLAGETVDPVQKASLIEMAQAWLLLFDQARKNSLNDLVYETPPRRDDARMQ
jgi:nitrate reductase assembly molybdenum cofactor insertion protein NarJ